MRVWITPTAGDLAEAANAEAWTGLCGLDVPETPGVATLPYASAFAAFVGHFESCGGCRAGLECSEGDDLSACARIGVEVQADMACLN